MTSCHLWLAGGLLSVMIYWFFSILLWLDFSLLLFSLHHRLEKVPSEPAAAKEVTTTAKEQPASVGQIPVWKKPFLATLFSISPFNGSLSQSLQHSKFPSASFLCDKIKTFPSMFRFKTSQCMRTFEGYHTAFAFFSWSILSVFLCLQF